MHWLKNYQDQRKRDTLERVKSAIESLRLENSSVSINAIVERVHELHAVKIAPSTILRNPAARELYELARSYRPRKKSHIRLSTSLNKKQQASVRQYAEKLLTENKKFLVNRIIEQDQVIRQLSQDNENLRDQLLLK